MDQSCQGIRQRITSLLFAIQTLWKALEQVSPEAIASNAQLRDHFDIFFGCVQPGRTSGCGLIIYRILQRIAIRLHIVMRVGQVKRLMATQTVNACLVLEEQRLAEAGKTIMVRALHFLSCR